ncbi:hypothetical protein N9L68_03380 [bacterium]|nr:hypothetical protein [bacterium]
MWWKPRGGSGPIFRAEPLDEEKVDDTRPKGNYELPICEAVPPNEAPEWKWHTRESLTGMADSAMAVVMRGESIFISGIGGTGKSYTMMEMVKQMQEKDIYVNIIAKCHVATLNVGQGLKEGTAMTAQAFVRYDNSIRWLCRGCFGPRGADANGYGDLTCNIEPGEDGGAIHIIGRSESASCHRRLLQRHTVRRGQFRE